MLCLPPPPPPHSHLHQHHHIPTSTIPSTTGVSMHTACSRCGMELPERVSSPWCAKCKRCVGLCSVCQRPVKGLLHWCPVCGHGGHIKCHKVISYPILAYVTHVNVTYSLCNFLVIRIIFILLLCVLYVKSNKINNND